MNVQRKDCIDTETEDMNNTSDDMANHELWKPDLSRVFRIGKLTTEFKKRGPVPDPFTARLFRGLYTDNKRELADIGHINELDLDFNKAEKIMDKFSKVFEKN